MKPNRWEQIPPYWAVDTTQDKNRRGPTKAFWASGDRDVEMIQQLVHLKSPVLDFGCGVGRLSRALINSGYDVISLDHSKQMLRECAKNVPDAIQIASLNHPLAKSCRSCVSMMTFQHIPVDEARVYLNQIDSIPILALHILTTDKRPLWKRMLWRASFWPGFAQVSNILRHRPINEPRIPLYFFPLSNKLLSMRKFSIPSKEFGSAIYYRCE